MSSPDPNRWQGTGGTNNPCPDGWIVPDANAWTATVSALPNPTFDCPLKIPFGGYRNGINTYSQGGEVLDQGVYGCFWSSTSYSPFTVTEYFGTSGSPSGDIYHSMGFSVRCIKDTSKTDKIDKD